MLYGLSGHHPQRKSGKSVLFRKNAAISVIQSSAAKSRYPLAASQAVNGDMHYSVIATDGHAKYSTLTLGDHEIEGPALVLNTCKGNPHSLAPDMAATLFI